MIGGSYDIKVAACAETVDLSDCGIEHNCCIDKELTDVNIAMQTITRKVFFKAVSSMMLILLFYAEELQKMIKLQREK